MSKHLGLKMSGILLATVFVLSLLGGSILMMTPGATSPEGLDDGSCRMVAVSLDEGYSISRIEMRQVCGFDR
ncbi:MAG: hypothetical protein ACK4MV_18975 [Beijerinckiaceae bacterium]